MQKTEFLQYFSKLINKNINAYKEMLIEDLQQNPVFEYATDEFFLKGIGIKNWLYQSQTTNFLQFSHPFKPNNYEQFYLNDFNNYTELLDKLSLSEPELYCYFSYDTFSKKSAAIENFPSTYYVTHKNLIERLDNRFIDCLTNDYINNATRMRLQKEITKEVSLMINYNPNRIEHHSLLSYSFPHVSLCIDEFQIKIISDLSELQLRAGNTFTMFYINATKEISKNGTLNIEYENNEPIIYHDKKKRKYIITNSFDRLRRFNTYIEITIKMYIHYIYLLERWLKKFIIPEILLYKS